MSGARGVAPIANAVTESVTQPIANVGRRATDQLTNMVRPQEQTPQQPQGFAQGTAGAAQVPREQTLQNLNQELPAPFPLTKGDVSNDFEQQRFERETAKNLDEQGERLRQNMAAKNEAFTHNLDEFINRTGAELENLTDIGVVVDKALKKRAERDKTKINVLYKEAEKAGELEQPVELPNVLRHLEESESLYGTVKSLKSIRDEAIKLNLAIEDPETGRHGS